MTVMTKELRERLLQGVELPTLVKCEVEDCTHEATSYWELGPGGEHGRNVCSEHYRVLELMRPMTPRTEAERRHGMTVWVQRSAVMRVRWSDGSMMLLTPLTGD